MKNTLFHPLHILNGLAGVALGSLSLSFLTMMGVPATASPVPIKPAVAESQLQATNRLTAAAKGPNAGLPDGLYLYGQAPKPDQVGMGYFVFEVNHGKVVGALYMPRSSFDCASGSFVGEQLALTVVNSYDRATNPFQIAVERTSNIASSQPTGSEIGLQGFHRLSSISQNDQRMLNTCKADLRK